MKSASKHVSHCYQSIVDNGRHHGVVLDLPGAKGGDDLGADAPENMATRGEAAANPQQTTMGTCPVGKLRTRRQAFRCR